MAELKTKPTKASVETFLKKISDDTRRQDCETVTALMKEVTGAEPELWGPSIVGFGRYHYKYASGREGDWMLMGFSPRKTDLTLYVLPGVHEFQELLPKLGKVKTAKACIYIKKLDDVDLKVLRKILKQALKSMSKYRTDNRD
jgi:uncharacterized protein YdhG (YjbR/CyaY superfamily)